MGLFENDTFVLFFMTLALLFLMGLKIDFMRQDIKKLKEIKTCYRTDQACSGKSISEQIDEYFLSKEAEQLKRDFIKKTGGDAHMKLLGNRLIIKRTIQQTSSIIITQSEEQPSIGEIIEVSSNVPSDFKVGDMVVYERYAGMDVPMGNLGTVTIIPCEAVVAVIVPDEKERADE